MSAARALAAALLAVGVMAAPARAGLWGDATATHHAQELDEVYATAMQRGDDQAAEANVNSINRRTMEAFIDNAIKAYETAAAAKPTAGEPYARIAKILFSFYFENCKDGDDRRSPLCPLTLDPDIINQSVSLHARAEQLMAAWTQFEARAPGDPRIDEHLLFERAILHTKLATHAHLEGAARDYEAIIRRNGGDMADEAILGNLAETYMMLGRLDEAIPMYERAIGMGAGGGAYYGLAVALDRDERAEAARNVIIDAGPQQYQAFLRQVITFNWFFVPPGEKFYYLALCEEAFGELDASLEHWNAFVKSGAHPQYQPRARDHIAALQLQLKLHPAITRPAPRINPFDD